MNKKEILIVEDSETCSFILNAFVKKNGFNGTCVKNGNEAVELFKNKAFDVIFMDIHLPHKTGPDVAKEMRKIAKETGRNIGKIIGISASMHTKDFHPEFDEVLLKPLRLSDIKNSIIS